MRANFFAGIWGCQLFRCRWRIDHSLPFSLLFRAAGRIGRDYGHESYIFCSAQSE
jgi:hypothetical protein